MAWWFQSEWEWHGGFRVSGSGMVVSEWVGVAWWFQSEWEWPSGFRVSGSGMVVSE